MHTLGHWMRIVLLGAIGTACGPSAGPDDASGGTPPPVEARSLRADAPTGPLPAGVRPLAYRVDLELDPRRDDFGGTVEIDLELDAATGRIWLHGEDLDVRRVEANVPGSETIPARWDEVLDPGVSAVTFEQPVPAGSATLRIDYRADFDRNLTGLFKVVEQGAPYALAKSESIQARSFLPGFDEPRYKATFDWSLTIPSDFHAIGNTPVVVREPAEGGMERVTFATTRPMPTYLLSLAVGPFDLVERPPIPTNDVRDRPVPLRGVARRGRGGDMNYVLDVTPGMLAIFETELKRPYPFEKLDIVAAPQWPSGATELSAAITYREQRLLVGDEPPPGARLALLGVHAHEIAHMWFGNLVTPPWWDDLWLKEGFATWATPLVLTLLEPDGGHELNAARRALSAMELDSLSSTRAIREPITDNNDIRNAYDAITYAKSLGVIHMVDQYFGPDRFRPALGRYVETFADGTADSADFYRVIGEETGTPALTDTFRSFVEQTGVPLLDVTVDCGDAAGTAVTVTQSRYRPMGSPIEDGGRQWTIPVCLRSDRGERCTMLEAGSGTIPLEGEGCPAWLLPNARGSGYYRFDLDVAGWQSLVAAFGELTPVEQLVTIDSAFAAFESGGLAPDILLGVVEAAAGAGPRQVVTAPFAYLAGYREPYFAAIARVAYQAFARGIYGPVLERAANTSGGEAELLRTEVLDFLARNAHDPEARAELAERAHAFTGYGMPRRADALPSDLYAGALIVAVQDSGPDFFAHLRRFRLELDDPLFESASAAAMGAATNPALVDDVHELVLADELGPRETYGLVERALAEPALRDQHWRWFKDNFPAVIERIPGQWRRNTPALARHFCSEAMRVELRQLFADHGSLAPGHARALAQTDERIALCAALRDRGQALGAALASRVGG